MSTTPTPINATPAKLSFWQKLESWFHKEAVTLASELKALLSSSEAQALEAGFTALIKTDLGKLATEAVTAAMDVETGKVNFSAAASSLLASAKSLGHSLKDSTVTTLIAAAQQKVESAFTVTTAPAAAAK